MMIYKHVRLFIFIFLLALSFYFTNGFLVAAKHIDAPTIIKISEEMSDNQLIVGLAPAETTVLFYIDGAYNGKTNILSHPSGTASFAYKPFLKLSDGDHKVWAIAENKEGEQSPPSTIINFTTKSIDITQEVKENENINEKNNNNTPEATLEIIPESDQEQIEESDDKLNEDDSMAGQDNEKIDTNNLDKDDLKDEEENDEEDEDDDSRLGLIIFTIFLVSIIIWLAWVNRELIKKKRAMIGLGKNNSEKNNDAKDDKND